MNCIGIICFFVIFIAPKNTNYVSYGHNIPFFLQFWIILMAPKSVTILREENTAGWIKVDLTFQHYIKNKYR